MHHEKCFPMSGLHLQSNSIGHTFFINIPPLIILLTCDLALILIFMGASLIFNIQIMTFTYGHSHGFECITGRRDLGKANYGLL